MLHLSDLFALKHLSLSPAGLTMLVGIVACAPGPAHPRTGLNIETTHASYQFPVPDGAVTVTVDNPGAARVTLASCIGGILPRLERLDGDTWIADEQYSCGPEPFEALIMEPGASMRASVHPRSTGTYRIRIAIYESPERVKYSQEASGPFVLR